MESILICKTIVTVDDFAVLLGVPTQLVSTMHRKGLLPTPLRIPGTRRLRWTAAAVNEWLAAQNKEDSK